MFYKRIAATYTVMIFILGFLCVNIVTIINSPAAEASQQNNRRALEVSEKRGNIYDCNLNPLVNEEKYYAAAVAPIGESASIMKNYLSGEDYSNLISRLSKGELVLVKTDEKIEDSEGITSLSPYLRYGENQLLAHTIGYLDTGSGKGVSGLEKSYDEYFTENSGTLSVAYYVDAVGRILSGGEDEIIYDGYNNKSGLVLTIDKEIQRIAEECADEGNLDKGSIVILDAENGKIKAMVSRPNFNPNKIEDYLNDENSPLINRSLTEYSVGSVFKLVVCAAALEAGISPNFTHDCTGQIEVDGIVFHCHKLDGHGVLDMKSGFALSCNTYFISLAQKVGKEKILETAEKMGFGTSVDIAHSLSCDAGYLPSLNDIATSGDLANLAFGQGKLMASPVQIAAAFLTVASGGNYCYPTIVEGFADENMNVTHSEQKPPTPVFDEKIVKQLQSFLKYSVDYGGGTLAKPEGSTAGGKTATAQTGWYKNGVEVYHAWFAGYYPADNPKYVMAILKEEGDGGSTDCAPIFRDIAEKIEAYENGGD